MNLGDAEDKALSYFDQQGFQIEEWPFFDASLEWRPRAKVTRNRRGLTSVAAIVVRENCNSYKEPYNWEPLVETRKKFPDLAIYFVVPETQILDPLKTELIELGVGLYIIKPDDSLEKVCLDRVPFDDLILSYPIEPNKRYRNKQNVMKVLANCKGYIWWLDKHFTTGGFDFLYDYLMNWPNRHPINEIHILGSNIIGPPEVAILRKNLFILKNELNKLNVITEMRLITNHHTLSELHDRYIISQNIAFNIMPINSLIKGQKGSLSVEDNPPDFQTIWNFASPL